MSEVLPATGTSLPTFAQHASRRVELIPLANLPMQTVHTKIESFVALCCMAPGRMYQVVCILTIKTIIPYSPKVPCRGEYGIIVLIVRMHTTWYIRPGAIQHNATKLSIFVCTVCIGKFARGISSTRLDACCANVGSDVPVAGSTSDI